ncbi:hypothetical protein BJX68DRAFT_253321 [Aspergillus pseudodeflectus]|uniref:Short-chain dehydrogenase n=1 Tax=Aspergillus pseudodeflectus TaxID=176178 RepID=A0ABR4KUZ0_9EURO
MTSHTSSFYHWRHSRKPRGSDVHSSGCGFTRAVILLVRDVAKVRSVVREINEVTPNTDVILTTIHLDDFTSVVDKIDVLINNAGIMAIPWATNKARIEKQLAVNHLGHFFSRSSFCLRFDWNFSDGKTYNSLTAYGQSKTANILVTVALADRLAEEHPGYMPSTSIIAHLRELDFKEIDAITRENTGFSADVEPKKALGQGLAAQSGRYLRGYQVAETRPYASDKESAEKLWKLSEELTSS